MPAPQDVPSPPRWAPGQHQGPSPNTTHLRKHGACSGMKGTVPLEEGAMGLDPGGADRGGGIKLEEGELADVKTCLQTIYTQHPGKDP